MQEAHLINYPTTNESFETHKAHTNEVEHDWLEDRIARRTRQIKMVVCFDQHCFED